MSLYYEGTKITRNLRLSDLNIVVGTYIKVIQTKIKISEIPNIIADINGEDRFTGEEGVA